MKWTNNSISLEGLASGVQGGNTHQPEASGDTNQKNHKSNTILPLQLCCCQGARVCLPTSGNRTQKWKHGPEVRSSPESTDTRKKGVDATITGPGSHHLPAGTPKGPPHPKSVTLHSGSKPCASRAFGCLRLSSDPPLLGGDPERTRGRLRSQLGSWRSRHGFEERSAEGPAERQALGQGSSSPVPARGAWSCEPGRAKAKVSGFPSPPSPPRSWSDCPGYQPSHRGGFSGHSGGSILAKSPLPNALLPAHSQTPRLTLSRVQVARGAHQQRGNGHQQRQGRRPPPAPSAHSCGSAGSGRIRARGAGPRGACSKAAAREALGAARPSLLRRRTTGHRLRPGGPSNSPGRALETAPGGERGLCRYKSGGAARWRRPRLRATAAGPRPAISGLGAPRCAPASRLSAPSARGLRSSDAPTNGRADKRTCGQAGGHLGWRVAGGRRERGLLGP